jgi:hypothetical protein
MLTDSVECDTALLPIYPAFHVGEVLVEFWQPPINEESGHPLCRQISIPIHDLPASLELINL